MMVKTAGIDPVAPTRSGVAELGQTPILFDTGLFAGTPDHFGRVAFEAMDKEPPQL